MRRFLPALLMPLLLGAAPASVEWAFPGVGPVVAQEETTSGGFALPGSTRRFTGVQLKDRMHAIDWRPEAHPAMPAAVRDGHPPAMFACGFCHLPSGAGRPENVALAGLSAAYIVEQVKELASGARDVHPGWAPIAGMQQLAREVTDPELAEAARYFAALPYRTHVRVIEAAQIPAAHAASFLYRLDPAGPREVLGTRIIEAPEDFRRFELRDETTPYVAYVPPGSIAAGGRLATSGGPAGQPCAICHGDGLKGSEIAPPLAGRSPSYIFRQLHAFATGARHGAGAAPMQAVAGPLSERQMIALAAFAGSRAP